MFYTKIESAISHYIDISIFLQKSTKLQPISGTLKCHSGYTAIGNPLVLCQTNYLFSEPQLSCEPESCGDLSLVEGFDATVVGVPNEGLGWLLVDECWWLESWIFHRKTWISSLKLGVCLLNFKHRNTLKVGGIFQQKNEVSTPTLDDDFGVRFSVRPQIIPQPGEGLQRAMLPERRMSECQNMCHIYPLVNWHDYGKSPFLMGKSTINCHFQ